MGTGDRAEGSEAEKGLSGQPPKASSSQAKDLTEVFRQVELGGEASTPNSSLREDRTARGATDLLGVVPELGHAAEAGFTRMFASLSMAAPEKADRNTHPDEDQSPAAPRAGAGEFTRAFAPAEVRRNTSDDGHPNLYGGPAADRAGSEMGGGFTQLLRTLSQEDAAGLQSSGAQALPSVRPLPEPPGEFTRIVALSSLRESQQPQQLGPKGTYASETTPEPARQNAAGAAVEDARQGLARGVDTRGLSPSAVPSMTQGALPAHASTPLPAAVPQGPARWSEYLPWLVLANLLATLALIVLVALSLARRS